MTMGAGRGRDNGLPPAEFYVALVDVDPPVADHVLDLLRDAGVSAFAEPIEGEPGPSRDVHPPTRPTERVHVDRHRSEVARGAVAAALPSLRADFHSAAAISSDQHDMQRSEQLNREDVDRAFEELVAGFGELPGTPPWPAAEDVDAASERTGLSWRLARRTEPTAPAGGDPDAEPGDTVDFSDFPWADPTPTEDEDEVAVAEERYEPPPPPPLPKLDPVRKAAWIGLVGGPVYLIGASLLGWELESWQATAALGAFAGGFAVLIARMRDEPPNGDGWDDGAVV